MVIWEACAPVGKPATFRYMISESAQHRPEVDHLDVTAFLDSEIDKDIYMVPEGVPEANTITKLKKALFGPETASRLAIDAFLLSLKFI